jgi:DNA (cytosine-5)-methyltransferase 1
MGRPKRSDGVCGHDGIEAAEIAALAAQQGYCAIEGFCGPGGISLGLQGAGFNVRLSFDIDVRAVETHKQNLRGECIQGDARTLQSSQLVKQAGSKKRGLDLFAGGPPCQGFSKQKRGAHLGDDRNSLVLEFVRFVEEIKPRFFLLENVAIFGQKRGARYLDEFRIRLKDYRLYTAFINCAEFGLAQTRQRFMIVGKRRDQQCAFSFPRGERSRMTTVGDVLSGLPEPPADYSDHPKFPNHQRARVTPINVQRFSHVPQGGGWQDIPKHLRLKCHQKVDTQSGGWPDVYGRLKWDGQCPTITGGFDSFTRGRYGHPLQDRPLTPREAARLQGFPDDFVFAGTRADIRSQIGNAVPPPVAKAVGIAIAKSLLVHDGLIEAIDEESSETQLNLFC